MFRNSVSINQYSAVLKASYVLEVLSAFSSSMHPLSPQLAHYSAHSSFVSVLQTDSTDLNFLSSYPEASNSGKLVDFDLETVEPDNAKGSSMDQYLSEDPWDICMGEEDSRLIVEADSRPNIGESNLSEAMGQSDTRKAVTGESESGLVFPITHLPIDMREYIFHAAIDNKLQDGSLTVSRTHPAVVMSHVCHEWRQIALNTAALWSHIHHPSSVPFLPV